MVAKFLDDSKPKTSLGKWIRPFSNFIDLIQFHSICWMLAKFSGVESEKTASEFRKRKRIFLCCAHHANSIERAREIRKFHVAVRLVHENQNSHTTTGWAESVSTDEKLLKALVTAIKNMGFLATRFPCMHPQILRLSRAWEKTQKLQAQVGKIESPKWHVWNLPKSATLNPLGTAQ